MSGTQITRWSPYAIDGGYDAYGEMEEDDVGDWVSYEDHAAHIDTQDAIAALPDMVVPLVWNQIDAVTLGATSVLGFTYTVWAIDGFGYVKFPGTPCGERFAGGIEAAKAAAQAHYVATILAAFGVQGEEA